MVIEGRKKEFRKRERLFDRQEWKRKKMRASSQRWPLIAMKSQIWSEKMRVLFGISDSRLIGFNLKSYEKTVEFLRTHRGDWGITSNSWLQDWSGYSALEADVWIERYIEIQYDWLNCCEFSSRKYQVCENVEMVSIWSGCHHQGNSTAVRGQKTNQTVAILGEFLIIPEINMRPQRCNGDRRKLKGAKSLFRQPRNNH
jgi:hypothetical protein